MKQGWIDDTRLAEIPREKLEDLLMSVLKEYASPKELNMLSQAMRMFHKSSY